MVYKIREMSPDERPREKLYSFGAGILTNSELLAILISTGTKDKSALDIAKDLTVNNGLVNQIARFKEVH